MGPDRTPDTRCHAIDRLALVVKARHNIGAMLDAVLGVTGQRDLNFAACHSEEIVNPELHCTDFTDL